MHKETTCTATEVGIVVWARAKPISLLQWGTAGVATKGAGRIATPLRGAVVALECLGDTLCSLHDDGVLRLWDLATVRTAAAADAVAAAGSPAAAAAERNSSGSSNGTPPLPGVPALAPAGALVRSVDLQLPLGCTPTAMLHPPTYVNKMAVGTSAGTVLIVNFNSGRIVHECRLAAGEGGSGTSASATAVTALAASPELDVIGIGFADGRTLVHNLRADRSIVLFSHAAADGASARGGISALAFSFDAAACAFPALVTATDTGALAVWNLDSRALAALLPASHDGAIASLFFLPRSPCVLTAGGDNALRVWQIDGLGGGGLSLLKSRSGHASPPRLLRFYGGASNGSLASGANAAACEVVTSGGPDCAVRSFHTGGLDRQNVELSQGSLTSRAKTLGVHPNALRLPPVIALAASDRRQGQWADVVTAHAGSSRLYLWSWEAKRLEERVCAMPDASEAVSAVTISACGAFAIAGGARGSLVKFNLQSAARRGTFPPAPGGPGRMAVKGPLRGSALYPGDALGAPDRDVGKGRGNGGGVAHLVDSYEAALAKAFGNVMPPPPPTGSKAGRGGNGAAASSGSGGKRIRGDNNADSSSSSGDKTSHAGSAIRGVGCDAFNSTIVSADADGTVLFWDFATHALRGSLALPSGATSLTLHRDSGLAALPCDDFVVRIVDSATRRLVRSFAGHTGRVCDAAFSPDARWCVTASLDSSLRVWDVPSGRCIDWLSFAHAPVSVAFSPTDESLVTAHVDCPGLSVWANRVHFGSAEGITASASGSAPLRPVMMDAPLILAAAAQHGDSGDEYGSSSSSSNNSSGGTSSAGERRFDDAPSDAPPSSSVPVIAPRSDCSLTLSGLPTSAWQNLTRLELIAARNKPSQPPTKPPSAPFFLPTTGGVNPVFVPPPPPPPTASASSLASAAAAASAGTSDASAGTGGGGTAFASSGEWDEEEEEDNDDAEGEGGTASSTAAGATVTTALDDDEADDDGYGADAGTSSLAAPAAATAAAVKLKSRGGSGRLLKSSGGRTARSVLASLLRSSLAPTQGDDDEGGDATLLPFDADSVAAHLSSLPPSAVDVELRSLCLGPGDADGMAVLGRLLGYFAVRVGSGRQFELTQAQLALTLQLFAETIAGDEALREAAGRIQSALDTHCARLSGLLDAGLCMLGRFLEH